MIDATKDRDGAAVSVEADLVLVAVGASVIGKSRTITRLLKRSPAFGADDIGSVLSVGTPSTCTLAQLVRAIVLKQWDNGDKHDRHD